MNVLHRLLYLNGHSLGSGTPSEGLEAYWNRCGLAGGGVPVGVGFGATEARLSVHLFPLPGIQADSVVELSV